MERAFILQRKARLLYTLRRSLVRIAMDIPRYDCKCIPRYVDAGPSHFDPKNMILRMTCLMNDGFMDDNFMDKGL
jgi:hypothetical protein